MRTAEWLDLSVSDVWTASVLCRVTSLLILLLALASPTIANAASILTLPAGESESLWVELVTTAEHWVGGADGSISLEEQTVGWVLVTRDPAGREHRVAVHAAADDEARMEVAMLAVSLLQPPVSRPTVRCPPTAPAVEDLPADLPPVEPEALELPADPPAKSAGGSFPASLGIFAALTGALELHGTQVRGGTIAVETGVGMPAGLRLALRVVLDGDFGWASMPSDPLGALPPIHLAVGGSVSWSADSPISPLVGIGGGVRWNIARSPDGLLRSRVRTPQLDVIIGLSVNPPGWLRFEPIALVRVGADVDLLGAPSTSSVPLDVSVLAGLKVALVTPARSPVRIDRRGR